VPTENKGLILFLEDIRPLSYRRILFQLRSPGKFNKPAAVVIRKFTELKIPNANLSEDAYRSSDIF
jgi:muramoyltetrapeptide carboxypeptidase LdcA involved in peptidoglycan recycling